MMKNLYYTELQIMGGILDLLLMMRKIMSMQGIFLIMENIEMNFQVLKK